MKTLKDKTKIIFRKLVMLIVLLFGFASISPAQVCGPGCPICSGSGQSTGALLSPKSIVSTAMAIPNGEDETGVFNLRAGVTPWLDAGLGYTVKSDKFVWSIRLQPLAEDEESWRPAIILEQAVYKLEDAISQLSSKSPKLLSSVRYFLLDYL